MPQRTVSDPKRLFMTDRYLVVHSNAAPSRFQGAMLCENPRYTSVNIAIGKTIPMLVDVLRNWTCANLEP